MYPVRGSVDVFAVIEYVNVAPFVCGSLAIVIQSSIVNACHSQPSGVATLTCPVAAAGGKLAFNGETSNAHGAPNWMIVPSCSATTMMPVRIKLVAFDATAYV